MASAVAGLLLALLLSGCTLNLQSLDLAREQWFSPWDKLDIAEAVAFAGLSAADGVESARNSAAGCPESDPLVTNLWGTRYPTSTDYAIDLALNAVFVLAVAEALPSTWRKLWLAGFMGSEAWAVVNNDQVTCFHTPPPVRLSASGD